MKTFSFAVLALFLSSTPTFSQNADAGTADGITLRRPSGESLYRITVAERQGTAEKIAAADFRLFTASDGVEHFDLIEWYEVDPVTHDRKGLRLDPDCRTAMGATDGTLGTVQVDNEADLSTIVPPCVPEALFGLVTDILSFLQIQRQDVCLSGEMIAESMATIPAVSVTWQRLPDVLDVHLANTGGRLYVGESRGDECIVEWRPQSFDFAMIRRTSPTQRILVQGHERFALRIEINPRTGLLLGGESVVDTLTLNAWPNYQADTVASSFVVPAGPSFPVSIGRSLKLERIAED